MTSGVQVIQPTFAPSRLPDNGKRFYIWTIGCQMNEADSSRVAAMLMEAGYRATDSEATADIVILNSCVVRQAAEDKVAGRLNALIREKRQRPDMSLVLTGCMVTNQQEKLAQRFPHVDLFFDPSDFDTFKAFVPELSDLEDDLETLPHYYVDTATDARVSAYVPI
ncbi:MAG: tRNA (N6-isopentenyl adenosine(37)-C2)-methylthiotransferase MiaB, partial [Thermomicrobiales bacterium]|nr:tRNA (N6-isopentenyl adenosine(37)-C2)-methylthiotransferase MiaB [Thermomicrobiales bacterium]